MSELGRLIEKYAELFVRVGLNVQPGQTIFLGAQRPVSVEHAEFARIVVQKAYEAGARMVHVRFDDDGVRRTVMAMTPEEALDEVPMHMIRWYEEEAEKGAAFGTIFGGNPDAYAGIDPARIARVTQAGARASSHLSHLLGAMKANWCIIAAPTRAWAAKVLPEVPAEQQVDRLWHHILKAARVTEGDPLQNWAEHISTLNDRRQRLNRCNFRRIHLRAPGTDLSVELPQGHQWVSVGSAHQEGKPVAVVNIPSEEVFTSPLKRGVNGTVRSTLPLSVAGTLVTGIRLKLENGRIVEYDADSGKGILKGIIETDEGARYLGEVALVPITSPIAESGLLYYNTLFDENASCHIAIGRGLPMCLEGSQDLSVEQLEAAGINFSATHVDFMIGSPEMEIDGETADGKSVPVFREGLWAI